MNLFHERCFDNKLRGIGIFLQQPAGQSGLIGGCFFLSDVRPNSHLIQRTAEQYVDLMIM